jgi:hypothetical protein
VRLIIMLISTVSRSVSASQVPSACMTA